jgi:hypothetical protein
MKTIQKQQGLTAITMVLILVLIAFFAMIVIRLFPIYMEHFSVVSHLEQLAKDPETKSLTDQEILSVLNKRFDIDDVRHVKKDNIFIERERDKSLTIAIEYEVRTPTIGNVDMVVSFSDEVDVN